MAKFQIYTYMYRPIMENQAESIPFKDFEQIDVQASLDKKQELTNEYLEDENRLKFVFNDLEYNHMTYIAQDGIYVFRIANNAHKPTKIENYFNVVEMENHPSCIVIIDNRKDRQVIAIEQNSAFGEGTPLSSILQTTLRKALIEKRLTLDIAPKFHTAEFWQVVETYMNLKGIEFVEFDFPYPNLPRISDMVGEYMTEVALRTNSEPRLRLKGQNKESVKLDPQDLWLLNAIKVCAASGRPILIKPKSTKTRKIGVQSPVLEEIPTQYIETLGEKELFDTKFQHIVEFLNTIKLVYE